MVQPKSLCKCHAGTALLSPRRKAATPWCTPADGNVMDLLSTTDLDFDAERDLDPQTRTAISSYHSTQSALQSREQLNSRCAACIDSLRSLALTRTSAC